MKEIETVHRVVTALSKRVRELESVASQCDHLRQLLDQDQLTARLAKSERELASLRQENVALVRSCRALELQSEHVGAQIEEAELVERLSRQNIFERTLDDDSSLIELDANDAGDLCGRCLLYVGGRPQTVCKLKEWVANHNGALLHHDGGIEHSAGMLGDLVRQADIVLFQSIASVMVRWAW